MDILFISSLDFTNNITIQYPSIGVLNLSTILKNKGFIVDILDIFHEINHKRIPINVDYEQMKTNIIEQILSCTPKIVGFSTTCDTYPIAIDIAGKLKACSPCTKVIFGGPQASITASETMELFNDIDLIAIGESERDIAEIVQALLENDFSRLHNIPNLIYRDASNEIIQTKSEAVFINIDLLPRISESFLTRYYGKEGGLKCYSLDIGRGCPFNCTYCSTSNFWHRKFRIKSVEKIISEIEWAHDTYGINFFRFVHDLFTAKKTYVLHLCEQIKKLNFPIKWTCSARIDTLDDEIMDALAAANCKGIFLGIETGSQRMQYVINKNFNIAEAEEKVKRLITKGFEPTCYFIYGFKDETIDDLTDTLKMAKRLFDYGVFDVQMYKFSPLPKT